MWGPNVLKGDYRRDDGWFVKRVTIGLLPTIACPPGELRQAVDSPKRVGMCSVRHDGASARGITSLVEITGHEQARRCGLGKQQSVAESRPKLRKKANAALAAPMEARPSYDSDQHER
jgi:hypothetical protein